MGQLTEMNPHQFADHLRSLGRRRAYLLYESDSRTFQSSHPALQQLADRLGVRRVAADAHPTGRIPRRRPRPAQRGKVWLMMNGWRIN